MINVSGGTFDYKQRAMENIADEILHKLENECDVREFCDDTHPLDAGEKAKAYMKLTAELLMQLYQFVHALDYWLAYDTSEEHFIQTFELQMQAIWSVASQGIMYGKVQGNPFKED